MEREKRLSFIIAFVIMISFASATINVGNSSDSLETIYGSNSTIKGWINVSLVDHSSESLISSIFGGSIKLIDLIKEKESNSGFSYTCTTNECEMGYSANNPEQTKQFFISAKQEDKVGLKLTGDLSNINNVNLTILSDAPLSCFNQLEIDFFDDGINDIMNYKMEELECPFYKRTGCFNESNSGMKNYDILNEPYCQRITLSNSPGFKLGAWIKKESGDMNLSMNIYTKSGQNTNKKCILPSASSEGSVISCNVEFAVLEDTDYYICVNKESGNGNYKIRGYNGNCGFVGLPQKQENAAFQIEATGLTFASPGQIEIKNKFTNNNNINSMIEQYIISKYGNDMNCPQDGCIIPIRINADQSQTITFSSLQLQYTDIGSTLENNYYNLESSSAKINSPYSKLYLDGANFNVPEDIGNHTFKVLVDGNEILSKEIKVEELPMIDGLSPSTTASAVPTIFRVLINNTLNITRYNWEFGDGKNATSISNQISYTYNNSGNYQLKISVTDNKQRTSYRIFDIEVKTPEEIINQTLEEKIQDIENVKEDINALPLYGKKIVESIIEADKIQSELKKIEIDYATASTEDDYKEIVTKLLALDVPSSVYESRQANGILFYPDIDKINVGVVSEVVSSSFDEDNEEEYQEAILSWYQDNIDMNLVYDEYSAKYERGNEIITKVFSLEITTKNSLNYNPIIFIKNMDSIKFKEEYLQEEEGDYIYTDISKDSTIIVFSTNESGVDFSNLEAFISPPLNRLSIDSGGSDNINDDKTNWTLFVLMIIFLIIIAIVVFIAMQLWYKKNYENALFKNKNNLYNLMAYIESSKRKGLERNEIETNLIRSGWKQEQIDYALNKHGGKGVGIIDFSKMFKKKDINKDKSMNPFIDRGGKRF
jgi:hypothetical protein